MEGKFRERAKSIWCPKPQPPRFVKDDVDVSLNGNPIGTMVVDAKRFTGWTNMIMCIGCDYLEEFHLENIGVFCTWPIPYDSGAKKNEMF